jgi:sugar phosphate permease
MYIVSGVSENRHPTHEELIDLRRWRISTFWVCLLGYIGYYICRANLPAAFPLMSTSFGYSNAQLGMIAAVSEGTYALGKFINGPIADKLGGKKIFLIGLAGAVFFNILFALSSTLFWFTAVWCLCRYFLSMGWGGLAKMIGNWYPPEKNGTIMGIISINFQFGGVVATLFAGYLVSIGVGWQGIFLYPALIGFVVLIWSALSSKNHPKEIVAGAEIAYHQSNKKPLLQYTDETTSVRKIVKELLKMRVFQQLLVFSFVAHILRSFFFFWTPKLLVDIGMGTSNAIFKSALFPLFGCLGTILLGWYSDRHIRNGDRARPMWIMLIGLSVSLIVLSQTVYVGSEQHWLIGIFLSLAGFFLLGPYSMSAGALTLDIAGPRGAGTSAGLIDGVGYIGGAVATFIAGLLSDRLGWQGVFYFLTFSSLLATLSAYIMSLEFQKMHAKRSAPDQESP